MLKYHIRTAFRNLVKHKGFTAINLIGLSSGVAVALLMSLYVHFELSYDSHFQQSEHIYRIYQQHLTDAGRSTAGLHFPAAPFLQQDCPEIAYIARIHPLLPRMGAYGDKQFMEAGFALADPEFFKVFGLKAIAGNLEEALKQPTDAVITESIAEKYFGNDWQRKKVIGETFRVKNNTNYQIAAVLPDLPGNTHLRFDILLPFGKVYGNFITNNWNFSGFYTYALLDENADQDSMSQRLVDFTGKYYPEQRKADISLALQPIRSIHLTSRLQGELSANGSLNQVYMFTLIALLIIAIAVMNFINLMTAMASRRHKEVGIKKVLGARRKSLISQFLSETLTLAFVAFLLAIGLADLLLSYFNHLIGVNLSITTLSQLSWVGGFIGLMFLTGIVSGLYPAVYLSKLAAMRALKNDQDGKPRNSMRRVLVTIQFVITTALIIGVITIYEQLNFMRSKDLGFDKDAVVMLKSHTRLNQQYDVFRNQLISHPAIENTSFSYGNLLGGGNFAVRALLSQEGGDEITPVPLLYTGYRLPETLNLELKQGRWFSRDMVTDTLKAFVINEAAAKAFGWGNEALGKRIRYFGGGTNSIEKDGRVVGVISDFHHESLYEELRPLIITLPTNYVATFPNAYIAVKLQTSEPGTALEAIESAWSELVPGVPLEMSFLDTKLNALYERDQRFGEIINASAILALLIAAIGVFGLASFIARSRTKELGIRKVLGASVKELLTMMLTGFLKPVLLAFFLAVPLAVFLLRNWLDGFAYKIDISAHIFIFTLVISLLVAAFAVMGQSLRAAKTNPVNVLRND